MDGVGTSSGGALPLISVGLVESCEADAEALTSLIARELAGTRAKVKAGETALDLDGLSPVPLETDFSFEVRRLNNPTDVASWLHVDALHIAYITADFNVAVDGLGLAQVLEKSRGGGFLVGRPDGESQACWP